ncbi:MAG: hypothetical protein F6K45_04145 [Kamptonema sp. SIO1D9]|nr:hypothetical protein [Kamptonema sp. SIO1D9]
MSDTTAFVAGCAIAGVGAIIFANGGLNFNQPNAPYVPQNQYANTAPYGNNNPYLTDPPAPVPVPGYPSPQQGNLDPRFNQQLNEQITLNQELQQQLELQKQQTEQLKLQLEQQKGETEQLLLQLEEQQNQSLSATGEQTNEMSLQAGVIWAVGGIVLALVIGGSIVIVGIIALLAQPQRRSSPRTTHVIQPVNFDYPYNYQRANEALPPQIRTRRVHHIERDD